MTTPVVEILDSKLPVPLSYAPEAQNAKGAELFFRPDLLSPEGVSLDLTTGLCLLAAVCEALRKSGYRRMPRGARIFVAENIYSPMEEVPRSQWGSFMLRHGMRASVSVKLSGGGGGGGGKNPLNTILSIVVIAVAVITQQWVAGPLLGKAILGSAAFAATSFSSAMGALAALGVMIGGMMLVSAIAPMSAPKLAAAKANSAAGAEKIWSIEGIKNKADLYGVVPLVLGKTRFAPRYFAQPYTYLSGDDQYARYLLGVLGHNKVENLRIGDTPVTQYKDVRYNIYENWAGEAFEFYPSAVYQENIGLTLKQTSGWHSRTTALNTKEIQWEIHFGSGLCHINKEGTMSSRSVAFQARYRPVGTEEWYGAISNIDSSGGSVAWTAMPGKPSGRPSSTGKTTTSVSAAVCLTGSGALSLSGGSRIGTATKTSTWGAARDGKYSDGDPRYAWTRTGTSYSATTAPEYSGSVSLSGDTITASAGRYVGMDFSVSRKTLTPVRVGFSAAVPEGQYEFQIQRVTADANPNTTTSTTRDEATWAILKSLRTGPVVKYTGIPYTIIELDIKATDQLSGHLDEINAVFTSYAPVWNGESWENAPTNNPASLCLMLATTPVIQRPVSMEDMDLAAWAGLYEWCEEHGWAFNSVETSQVYAGDEVQAILSACRASFAVRNGKFGCVWDAPDKPMTYPYGPRNSWGFQGSKAFVKEEVHGLRYRFLNERRDYQEDEMVVFADGYNDDNATNIIDVEQDGCTSPALIDKMGRLRLADSQWRTEIYTFSTDFSHLFVSKGDRIPLTHDVPMWGICQARVMDAAYADLDLEGMNRAALASVATAHQARFVAGRGADGALAPLSEFTAWLDTLDDAALRDAIFDAGIKDTDWVIGIVIDDYVSMEAGKNYAFRHFATVGSSKAYSVETEPGTTNVLRLQTSIPAVSAPAHDGLIHFGEAERETHDCIVVSIETEDNLCAKITCQDYAAEQIYAALTGPVPPWDSGITIPSRWQLGKPDAPSVLGIISDEYAMIRTGNGALLSRIQVTFAIAQRRNVVVEDVRIEIRELDSGAEWTVAGSAKASSGVVYADNVLEGVTYELRLIAISQTGAASEYSSVHTCEVIGRTSLPPNVERFTATIVDASGVILFWDEVEVIDFDHYRIGGAVEMTVKSANALAQVYKATGEIEFSCVAVDTIGLVSPEPAVASVWIDPPDSPILTATPDFGGARLRWQDCARTWPIASYSIDDTDKGAAYSLNAQEMTITPRGVGSYLFEATAEDICQNVSATGQSSIVVTAPENPVPRISVDGADLVVSWDMVRSFFPIDFYEVYTVDWQFVQQDKANRVRFPATGLGVREYRVRAVDIAGNASDWVEVNLEITPPRIPQVSISLNEGRDGMILKWASGGSMLPVVAWDVVRQWEKDLGGGTVEALEEDFGRLDADSLAVPAVPVGEHYYMVRAVDSAGNRSLWGEARFTPQAPGRVLFQGSAAIDNNFLLYWTEPDSIFYAIAYYLFSQVDGDGYEMEIGRIDALFASAFESVAGDYRYRVTPVDVAGNMGIASDITMRLAQPPDFVLYHDHDSLFNGTRTNMILDGHGSMYGPVPENETWQDNINRSAPALGLSADNLTWNDKVSGGQGYYHSPAISPGSYQEIVDVGALVPSTKISVKVTSAALEGSPVLGCTIETSHDGNAWTVLAENAFEVYASNFRYVRYTFTLAGGLLKISNINYSLNVKRMTDFGTVHCAADDNGEGYPADPDRIGTRVLFNMRFTDVNGAPICSVVNNSPSNPLTAYTVFKDTLNPTEFRVFVLDKNGNRATATVSWSAQGV